MLKRTKGFVSLAAAIALMLGLCSCQRSRHRRADGKDNKENRCVKCKCQRRRIHLASARLYTAFLSVQHSV